MKKPYLIQRVGVRREERGQDETFDQVLSCDYMGSAEFEFGALPKSLKRICKNLDTFTHCETEVINKLGENLYVFINKTEDLDEYLLHILDIISGNLYLKEQTHIEYFITGKKFNRELTTNDYKYDYNIWWDIENDVFFCFGLEKIEMVIKAMRNTKEKKKKENIEGWF